MTKSPTNQGQNAKDSPAKHAVTSFATLLAQQAAAEWISSLSHSTTNEVIEDTSDDQL